MPGIPTSDRERECDRFKGDRVRECAGGSGESDKVIMTSSFPTRSGGAPELDPTMELESLQSEVGDHLFSGRCCGGDGDGDGDSPIMKVESDQQGKGEGNRLGFRLVKGIGDRKERTPTSGAL